MPNPSALTVREARPGADDDVVAELIGQYLAWALRRLADEYGVDDLPTDPARVRQGLADYRRPQGILLLVEDAGRPVGVGAARNLGAGISEVKRMFVLPDVRSRHAGSKILDRLIQEARAIGAHTLRLDTCRFMTDAQGLYRSRGFVERSPYEGTEIPARLQQHWLFFERSLNVAGDPKPQSGTAKGKKREVRSGRDSKPRFPTPSR